MDTGLSILSQAMTRQLHTTDVIANNIANSNTTGYKQMGISTYSSFADELSKNIQADIAAKETTLHSTIPQISKSYIDANAGAIQITNNQYDFALKDPNMMFAIQLENDKIGYTRDGSFKILDNMLTTGDGKLVLSTDGGPIEVEEGQVPNLGVVNIDFKDIKPFGDNTYITKSEELMPFVDRAEDYIMQGSLESSNTNIVKAMTDLITAHREYEYMSKLMKDIDEINSKAASEVGNVKG